MITIIDYAVNNLNSVEKAFRSLKIPVEITDNTRKIREADKLVLPGVGAFGDAVNNLKTKKIFELLREKAETGSPILGLCLGLQLFFTESENRSFSRYLKVRCDGLQIMSNIYRVVFFGKINIFD